MGWVYSEGILHCCGVFFGRDISKMFHVFKIVFRAGSRVMYVCRIL